MAHPHATSRQHLVEKSRVAHLTKHYASGGAVHGDEKADKALIKRTVKKSAMRMAGGGVKHRADHRARGGRTKHKGTTINIINAGHPGAGAGGPAMPPGGPVAGLAPRPPMPAMPPPAPAGAMPPGMPPGGPMMPPRSKGGRAFAKGGAVKSGPAWEEGVRNGTQPKNSPGKDDRKDMFRGKPITYKSGGQVVSFKARGGVVKFKTGGRVESPNGVDPATKLPSGSGGARARLAKEHRAERDFHPKNRLES